MGPCLVPFISGRAGPGRRKPCASSALGQRPGARATFPGSSIDFVLIGLRLGSLGAVLAALCVGADPPRKAEKVAGGAAQGQTRKDKTVTILETSHQKADVRTKPGLQVAPPDILSPQRRFVTPSDTGPRRHPVSKPLCTVASGILCPTGVLIFFKSLFSCA